MTSRVRRAPRSRAKTRFVARQDAHIVAVPRVLRRAVAGTFVRAVLVCSVCSLLFAGSLAPPAFAILSFSDVPDSNPLSLNPPQGVSGARFMCWLIQTVPTCNSFTSLRPRA